MDIRGIVLAATFLSAASVYAEVYKVALFDNHVPYVTHDEVGNLTGLDVDLIKAIAADQKIEVEFFAHEFTDTFDGLNNGSRDIVAGGFTISNERRDRYAVSHPYYIAKYAVASLEGSYLNLNAENLSKYRVAVQKDSFDAQVLEHALGVKQKQANKTSFLSLKSLAQGQVDGYFSSEANLCYLSYRHPEMKLQVYVFPDSEVSAEEKGFFVNKQNQQLLDKVNKGFKNILASGKYDEIVKKWALACK